jgi:hypothetical protein
VTFSLALSFKEVVVPSRKVVAIKARSVARVLTFDDPDVADRVLEPPSFSASPVSIPKKRGQPRKT